MVNPISAAYNMFLGFFSILPEPIRYFVFLVLGLFFILCIVKVVMYH